MSTRAFANDLGPAPGKWRGGVATVDGKIVCAPFNASACLVIDPVSGTCSADHEAYSGLGDGPAKWSGAVLGADHKVYCTPCLSERVLVLDLAAGTADCSTYTCEAFQRRRVAAEKTERDSFAHLQHLESSAALKLETTKTSVEKLERFDIQRNYFEVVKKLLFAVLALLGHHKPDWSAVQKELVNVNAFHDSLLGVLSVFEQLLGPLTTVRLHCVLILCSGAVPSPLAFAESEEALIDPGSCVGSVASFLVSSADFACRSAMAF